MGDSALTNFAEQIMANRRANMIAEAMDNSEYWRAQYQVMFDKYNNLVKEYNHDIAEAHVEFECLANIMRENEDAIPYTKEDINNMLDEARKNFEMDYKG